MGRRRPLHSLRRFDVPGIATPEREWLRDRGASPRLSCTSYEVQLAAVRAGLGVALVPRAVLASHRDLVALEEHPAGPSLELFLVTRRAIRTLPRIVATIEVVEAELGALSEE